MVKTDEHLNGGVTWIVVADASEARIFSRRKRYGELEPVHRLAEPATRERERNLASDAPGRSFDSVGDGRHAMEPDTSGRDSLRRAFAGRIAGELDAARIEGRFERLVIVAAPKTLGDLRAQLSSPTQRCVRAEFDKDMARSEPADIVALIDGET